MQARTDLTFRNMPDYSGRLLSWNVTLFAILPWRPVFPYDECQVCSPSIRQPWSLYFRIYFSYSMSFGKPIPQGISHNFWFSNRQNKMPTAAEVSMAFSPMLTPVLVAWIDCNYCSTRLNRIPSINKVTLGIFSCFPNVLKVRIYTLWMRRGTVKENSPATI